MNYQTARRLMDELDSVDLPAGTGLLIGFQDCLAKGEYIVKVEFLLDGESRGRMVFGQTTVLSAVSEVEAGLGRLASLRDSPPESQARWLNSAISRIFRVCPRPTPARSTAIRLLMATECDDLPVPAVQANANGQIKMVFHQGDRPSTSIVIEVSHTGQDLALGYNAMRAKDPMVIPKLRSYVEQIRRGAGVTAEEMFDLCLVGAAK